MMSKSPYMGELCQKLHSLQHIALIREHAVMLRSQSTEKSAWLQALSP